jgi:c-di-GMP-related signal transduction protein
LTLLPGTLEIRELESLMKSEASVCYHLLQYLNAAAIGVRNEVHSIGRAITLLGEREVGECHRYSNRQSE